MESAPLAAAPAVLIFAGASFFFALAETALFSLGKWQARQLAERNPRAGAIVTRLLEHPQDLLAAMVLGNTFATAAMLILALWMGLSGHWLLWPTVGWLLLLILFGCEVLPKTLAVRRPDAWALRVARPLLLFQKFPWPLRWLAKKLNETVLAVVVPQSVKPQTALTDADYHELLELATQQGALAEAEKETILQIISLDRRMAKDVMRPRSRMACIPDDLSVEEMIAMRERGRITS